MVAPRRIFSRTNHRPTVLTEVTATMPKAIRRRAISAALQRTRGTPFSRGRLQANAAACAPTSGGKRRGAPSLGKSSMLRLSTQRLRHLRTVRSIQTASLAIFRLLQSGGQMPTAKCGPRALYLEGYCGRSPAGVGTALLLVFIRSDIWAWVHPSFTSKPNTTCYNRPSSNSVRTCETVCSV